MTTRNPTTANEALDALEQTMRLLRRIDEATRHILQERFTAAPTGREPDDDDGR